MHSGSGAACATRRQHPAWPAAAARVAHHLSACAGRGTRRGRARRAGRASKLGSQCGAQACSSRGTGELGRGCSAACARAAAARAVCSSTCRPAAGHERSARAERNGRRCRCAGAGALASRGSATCDPGPCLRARRLAAAPRPQPWSPLKPYPQPAQAPAGWPMRCGRARRPARAAAHRAGPANRPARPGREVAVAARHLAARRAGGRPGAAVPRQPLAPRLRATAQRAGRISHCMSTPPHKPNTSSCKYDVRFMLTKRYEAQCKQV